jgi:hypothetical protein
MKKRIPFERPNDLEEGKTYFLRLSLNGERIPLFIQVSFLGYTACPAVVLVRDARKASLRCSREDLFHNTRLSNV